MIQFHPINGNYTPERTGLLLSHNEGIRETRENSTGDRGLTEVTWQNGIHNRFPDFGLTLQRDFRASAIAQSQ
tara:strand:+ start:355 stop:573 length:219 start_codon:yes stop_codon:yes gene_type:complete